MSEKKFYTMYGMNIKRYAYNEKQYKIGDHIIIKKEMGIKTFVGEHNYKMVFELIDDSYVEFFTRVPLVELESYDSGKGIFYVTKRKANEKILVPSSPNEVSQIFSNYGGKETLKIKIAYQKFVLEAYEAMLIKKQLENQNNSITDLDKPKKLKLINSHKSK